LSEILRLHQDVFLSNLRSNSDNIDQSFLNNSEPRKLFNLFLGQRRYLDLVAPFWWQEAKAFQCLDAAVPVMVIVRALELRV
jgi:hypothetical protein